MIRKDITQSELLSSVCKYEKDVLNADFVCKMESERIYRFKAFRHEKLAIVLPAVAFSSKLEEIIGQAAKMVLDDSSLSDHIDVYTTGVITEKRAGELDIPLRQQGLSVSFFDSTKMGVTKQFEGLFVEENQEEVENEIDPAFFDYLALSNDSSDIKNGFFFSLILIEVYRHQPVNEEEFYDICQTKYGRQKSEVSIALKNLRKKEKITQLQKGGFFSLTEEEQRNLEKACKESKEEELTFKAELEKIVVRYGFRDVGAFLEMLKKEYLSKYSILSKTDDNVEDQKHPKLDTRGSGWDEMFQGMVEDEANSFRDELKQLCTSTDYLDQYGLIHAFLDLFRSDCYEDYLKQKENCLYLDTPVIVYYLCEKSRFQADYGVDWDNSEFVSANDLFGYIDESKDKISLLIPHDYLWETIGEMKKALQLNWFTQFPDLPIPIETANTFYNYYQIIRTAKLQSGESVKDFTLEAFARQLGFDSQNPQEGNFSIKNMASLRFFLSKLGCKTLERVDVNYSIFEKVKEGYIWSLHDKGKEKTGVAIDADVRQSIHITGEVKATEKNERDFYLVSWDQSLYDLRNKTREEMEVAGRSYAIFNPGELAEKMAFRSFKISKESVSNEVFAYASSSFNVKDKIRSLYDNVLNPFFASIGKPNSALVWEVLKMQRASIEGEVEKPKEEKTAFENIFLSILAELPKYNCSPQNLKDYLNDDANNDAIIPLFTKAFEDFGKGKKDNIAKKICDLVKGYVSKDDKEIML